MHHEIRVIARQRLAALTLTGLGLLVLRRMVLPHVAQAAERPTVNREAAGPNPVVGAIRIIALGAIQGNIFIQTDIMLDRSGMNEHTHAYEQAPILHPHPNPQPFVRGVLYEGDNTGDRGFAQYHHQTSH